MTTENIQEQDWDFLWSNKFHDRRTDVLAVTRYDTLNYNLDAAYQVEGKKAAIIGFDEAALEIFPAAAMTEGSFPHEKGQVLLDENAGRQLGLKIGDEIVLHTPEEELIGGAVTYQVSGFVGEMSSLRKADVYGLMMNMDSFRELALKGTGDVDESFVYVKFSPRCRIGDSIEEIQNALGLTKEQVVRNTLLLATMGQSDDPTILAIYLTALALAILVSIAGILMIAGSLNSNVARRTEFFGMLRFLSPMYFADMPVWGVSWIGMAGGIVIGVITVLLAARSPAKRAAGVSPLTAVSGNANKGARVRRSANTRLFRVDTALGIHHAMESRKNLFLISGSFAFSIILFLSFSVLVDFMTHGIKPMRSYTPDLSIISPDNTCSVAGDLITEIQKLSGVKRVYGRSFVYDVPMQTSTGAKQVNLISYEENQFDWAETCLKEGTLEEVEAGEGVLVIHDENNPFTIGDEITLTVGGKKEPVTVRAIAAYSPFDQEDGKGTVICSQSLFEELTGERAYTIIDIQLTRRGDDALVDQIHMLAGDALIFSDARMSNAEVRGAGYGFGLFVYGFLAVIALIGIFNEVNCISMSVSARIRQYGAMRAVGMDSSQVTRMIVAEAAAYGILGGVTGAAIGLALNCLFYHVLIASHWGDEWRVPVFSLGIILTVMAAALILAIYGPSKRIRKMTVVDVIGAQ